MLDCFFEKSRRIENVIQDDFGITMCAEAGMMRVDFYGENILRVRYTQKNDFSKEEKVGIVVHSQRGLFSVNETEDFFFLQTKKLELKINKETGSFTYCNGRGEVLLQEAEEGSKRLEEFQSFVPYEKEEVKTEIIHTADGEKEIIKEVAKIPGEKVYHTKLKLRFDESEAIYGFGQNEENLLNLRGQTVYVHQANRKIAMPLMVSTKGYGILVNTYSPMIFNDTIQGTYLYTEADPEMDFFFLAGDNMHQVQKGYRFLTGKVAMLPKWAFGYIQSQERYETAEEILSVAKEHRERQIGLDCIVLDWCSWEDGMWGQKSFDPKRFPNPTEMVQKLHEMDVHFMISIWPNMAKETENHKEMAKEGGLLFASDLYNPLDSHVRDVYWNQVNDKLFCHGIDAFWCDSSEPLTVEWVHKERMEPGLLYAEYCRELQNRLPITKMNAYPYYHAQTIYEGQRRVTEEKRVCNLTRSTYTGGQKFGTILWSGDTSASWNTLKSQVAAGLNFVSSGHPFWTVDIGAFFVKRGDFWYWDGDYNQTNYDEGYLELYTRWYQWASLLPVFRGHGTDVRRELWQFCGQDGRFFEAMLKYNRLRYRLLPYIYSMAGMAYLRDEMMMRPLSFDFAEDKNVYDIKDQYMFGDALMVCPVTEPMYYGRNSEPLQGTSKTRKVYIPKGSGFYDFWSGEYYEAGQWITVNASLENMPILVREGSILPLDEERVSVSKLNAKEERETLSFRVYAGKDADFHLYQDAGDGYGYEKGEYELTDYHWDDKKKLLTENGNIISKIEVIERK